MQNTLQICQQKYDIRLQNFVKTTSLEPEVKRAIEPETVCFGECREDVYPLRVTIRGDFARQTFSREVFTSDIVVGTINDLDPMNDILLVDMDQIQIGT